MAAHDDDAQRLLVGDAVVVRDAFEQLPVIVTALAGPDHRVVAVNAAYRAFTGRSDVIGGSYAAAFPGIEERQLRQLLDRVYATGQPETGRPWRTRVSRGPGEDIEACADFRVLPRRAADGAVSGLLVIATDVTERRPARPAADGWYAADAPDTGLAVALPVLPRARIAARYLVAGSGEAPAGGDWSDAIPLDGGTVALIVGDVVGRGGAASTAIGQLRAVLAELLTAEADLGRVLQRTDAFAARTPALRAATLSLAVLDPAAGTLRYTTCGHPPPLVVRPGGKARFLAGTGSGPLGTGSTPVLADVELAPGELVLLYSDGLIERPDRTIPEGMDELAAVAADAIAAGAASGDAADGDASGARVVAAEHVCQLTVERLTNGGYTDDVTVLAAQRLADAAPPLHLELPSERASLTVARDAFTAWLIQLDASVEDREALHLALVEIVTNAIEHAYPRDEPGIVELTAALGDDGYVECRITDHGTWRRPDPADADRGHGLMVASHVVDTLLVSHSAHGTPGTVVAMRHRLSRPALPAAASGERGGPADDGLAGDGSPELPFVADTSIEPDGTARALVSGPVNINTADRLARRLLSASRGGTVPLIADLTGVTQLASAGVRALYQVKERLAAHAQDLTLITMPGSSAHIVLDLVQLRHQGLAGPATG
jgi:anti-sigma regulatory factor (Ser/Thr protein kinase)/anti-anti-sigma regulatory factor